MRLGSATHRLLPILLLFLFATLAFPNPVFINPAFQSGDMFSEQAPLGVGLPSMIQFAPNVAAFPSPNLPVPMGFTDVMIGQSYQFLPAGIGWSAGTSTYTAPSMLIDFVPVANYDFRQLTSGVISPVTFNYEAMGASMNRAFTFDWYTPGGNPLSFYQGGNPLSLYHGLDPTSPLPEPSTIGLGALGLAAFVCAGWVRRKRSADRHSH
jgi:hypothetical protein